MFSSIKEKFLAPLYNLKKMFGWEEGENFYPSSVRVPVGVGRGVFFTGYTTVLVSSTEPALKQSIFLKKIKILIQNIKYQIINGKN